MKNDFEIFFSSGYSNDTVSLMLNGVIVFENEILTTGFSTGLTEMQVICIENSLMINRNTQTKLFSKTGNILNCMISINHKDIENMINLKNGKFILFEKNKKTNYISYRQFKKRPIFE